MFMALVRSNNAVRTAVGSLRFGYPLKSRDGMLICPEPIFRQPAGAQNPAI